MIEHALTHGVTKSLLGWLRGSRSGTVPSDPTDHSIELRFGSPYRVAVAAGFLLATGFLLGGVLAVGEDRQAQVIVGVVFGALWFGMIYGVYDAYGVQLKASPRGIRSKSWLRQEREMYWEQIDRISYASIGNWYTFRSSQGWSVRVSIYRNGLRSFADLVAANVGRSPARLTPRQFYQHTA
jgi:hypothetical protein